MRWLRTIKLPTTGNLTIIPGGADLCGEHRDPQLWRRQPALSGTTSGYPGTDTQANATTGTLSFADAGDGRRAMSAGYLITGSGLTANNGNYSFVQAAGNANRR